MTKKNLLFLTFFSLMIITACSKQAETEPAIEENTSFELQADGSMFIYEAKTEIKIPKSYELVKNAEENRRGSFLSYEFKAKNKTYPIFAEIQFFSKESIETFNEKCKTVDSCFIGNYPTVELYEAQKGFFEGLNYPPFNEHELKNFNDRPYFVSNIPCTGDRCIIREYTTFIGEVKIDIWIMMNETQVEEADKLFAENSLITIPFNRDLD